MFGDIAYRAVPDRHDLFAVAFLEVWDKVLVSPVLPERDDPGKFINLELLVFGGMGIVESPLLKWDVSTDKV